MIVMICFLFNSIKEFTSIRQYMVRINSVSYKKKFSTLLVHESLHCNLINLLHMRSITAVYIR